MAVLWAALLPYPYLEGSHLIVGADQQALRCILDLKYSTANLARQGPRFMEFDFEIVHRSGLSYKAADAMS